MAEPKIVVQHREHLWYLLAEAMQLEHMIMCQYLYAGFSLKQDAGEGLTAGQAAAVAKWRKVLRGIAVEEMLHLALAANLMSAIGAAPTFGRPNFPQRSNYFPPSVQLDLLPFGDAALTHFLYLERPEGMERVDADGFAPAAPAHQLGRTGRGNAPDTGFSHRRAPLPWHRGRAHISRRPDWRARGIRRPAARASNAGDVPLAGPNCRDGPGVRAPGN